MPTLTITKSYADGNVLTEAQIDDIKDSIETFVNTTGIDDDNIQTGGVGTTSLAASAVTAAKIATAVAGDGLAGGAGTALSVNVDDTGIEISTDTLQLKDSGVTTAKIAAQAVTRAKMEQVTPTTDGSDPGAGGVVYSSASGTVTTTATSRTDITNLSVTLTTTGRPVRLLLQPSGGSSQAWIGLTKSSSNTVEAIFSFDQGGTQIFSSTLSTGRTNASNDDAHVPPGAMDCIYTVAAGTYTFKAQYHVSAANAQAEAKNCELVAYEI